MQPSDPATPVPVFEPADAITWEASESLAHDNGFGWYAAFAAVVIVLVAFAIFFHFWIFVAVVILMAIAAIIHVRQPPRTLRYELSDDGLRIDNVIHPYASYKSFSVIQDGGLFAILLIPARRIAASTIVYFDEADGEAIVDAFGDRLPMEHRELDPVDRFLRLIRF